MHDLDASPKMTLLVVLEANNNLKRDAFDNINEMEYGMSEDNKSNVLVLLRAHDHKYTLYNLKHDKDLNKINSDVVKEFYENFSNEITLAEIAQYVQTEFPAESHGLLLWSHATSWVPPETQMQTKSFGSDRGKEMDIQILAKKLPRNYDYIVFDACNMASIEVLYEFRENAKYLLASPSEVISTGFPYRDIMQDLTNSDLKIVGTKYFNYYNNQSGMSQSGTISLINSAELSQLSASFSELLMEVKDQNIFNRDGVQRLDFTDSFPVSTYDFRGYLERNFSGIQAEKLHNQIERTVLYKSHTRRYFNTPIESFSGITCFIPYKENPYINYYMGLAWVVDSGLQKHLQKSFDINSSAISLKN